MAVGQHEAVTVGPLRVGRVVTHDPAVEHVGERSERHRRPLVPALGVQRRIHCHATDKGDRGRFEIGGERCRLSRATLFRRPTGPCPEPGNTLRCDMSGPVRPVDVDGVDGAHVDDPAPHVLELTPGRESIVGETTVRRSLPTRRRRAVGPWCFLDHAPEVLVDGGRGMQVGPHPHIGLQTVTWLLDGEVVHRDSLGSEQTIRPGSST